MPCQTFFYLITLIRYEIKSAEHIFHQKKNLFPEYWRKFYTVESSFSSCNKKKIKTGPKFKNKFFVDFIFIFLFFFSKNFFIFEKFEKKIADSGRQ